MRSERVSGEAEFAFFWHSNNETIQKLKTQTEDRILRRNQRENLFESCSKEGNLKATNDELKDQHWLDRYQSRC